MSRKNRGKERGQRVHGERYVPLPHSLLNHEAWQGASGSARALYVDLASQHNNDDNNGQLHLAWSWLKKRGWKSKDTVQRAKEALIESGLIVETRKGGINNGANRYALSYFRISDFRGLDITREIYESECFRAFDRRKATPESGSDRPGTGTSTPPSIGASESIAGLPAGAKEAVSQRVAGPETGHNSRIAIPDRIMSGADAMVFTAPTSDDAVLPDPMLVRHEAPFLSFMRGRW